MFAKTDEIRWLPLDERINPVCEWKYLGSEAQELPTLGEHLRAGGARGADWET